MSKHDLTNKKIAILATDGFEQVELTKPRAAVEEVGAKTSVVSLKGGKIQGFNHFDKGDEFPVDTTVDKADPSDFNGLILPGGVHNPDTLRGSKEAVEEFAEGKHAMQTV